MQRSKNSILRETTEDYLKDYLATLNPGDDIDPAAIETELLEKVADEIELENAVRAKGRKLMTPLELTCTQIAVIVATLYPVCSIPCAGADSDPSYDTLALYQEDGPDQGTYQTSEDAFRSLAKSYNYNLNTAGFNEFMQELRLLVERKYLCSDPDLVAVNNGIFNYKTKQLMDFSPELVFLTKSRVDYNPNAVNPVIHNDDDGTDWDVESWMKELSDDQDIVEVLWQILGAIIRPNVRWNKSAWFYSTTGNNGKGTLCELMRQLCGPGSFASISLVDFSKEFMLEPLIHATAIIVDENDVGTFIDKAANLKAVITNDVIQINRKFKTPVSFQFKGFMVQCLNEFPRIKDRSDSFYRRQLFVPFEKCFTGHERKYIKADYLHRKEVLEYVMYRVLNMNYYSLSEPDSCTEVLKEYKEFNDPVRQFADDIFPFLQWDLVPFTFLYDLYKAWMKKNAPTGGIQGRNTFINDVLGLLTTMPEWQCPGKSVRIRPRNMMDRAEPLIHKYDLRDWMNPNYSGDSYSKRSHPILNDSYRGILRVSGAAQTLIPNDERPDSTPLTEELLEQVREEYDE